jgi:hypothetical protein
VVGEISNSPASKKNREPVFYNTTITGQSTAI